jgi:benzoylformate decarboxylase
LPSGTRLVHITDDPDEAARPPVGDSIVGDVRRALERLCRSVPVAHSAAPTARKPPREASGADPISAAFAMRSLAEAMPTGCIVVEESASSRAEFSDQISLLIPRLANPWVSRWGGSSVSGGALPITAP